MSCDEVRKKTIIEIFNEMEYEEKVDNHNFEGSGDSSKTGFKYPGELSQISKISKEPKPFDIAVNAADNAQKIWKNTSALQRADSLHRIWKCLKEIPSSLKIFKNEFLTFVDYFDYYTDLSVQTEEYKNWKPHGIVLVVLSHSSHLFLLGAIIPAALATGCSVILLAPERIKFIPMHLQIIMEEAGLQEGLFNVVADFNESDIPLSPKVHKIIFCGSYLAAQKLYTRSVLQSFSFFCPNNTAALILESCDLSAAVDKIVTETWDKNSLFTVNNVVVQESIHESFLEKLKHRIEQLIMENINSSKFKDKNMSEKINKVVSEAAKAGGTIEKCFKYENETEWSPTIIINYQDQNTDEDVPILKVLLCRTAKEGVSLLNNCHYSLGTSIWSEISSQALEVSSMLNCPNVWINCHGVFEADVPFQPSGISGNCVLGGSDGMLEYMSFRITEPVEKYKPDEDVITNFDKINTLQMAASTHQAFNNWRQTNRRKYLKDIGNAIRDNKDLSESSEIIIRYAHFGNVFHLSEKNSTKEFSVIRNKIPIGVILLVVNTKDIDAANLNLFITPAIALGNTVIVVLKEDSQSVKLLVKNFNAFLPKNVLNVVVGLHNGIQLASDPNIQAVWIHEESTVSIKFLDIIRNKMAKRLKHVWIIPKSIIISQHLFQKECLRNKIVWLTKVDQFP